MKKILLILAITSALVSCSSKDENVKKEVKTTEVVAAQPVDETATEEMAPVEEVNTEEPAVVSDEDYKSVSESVENQKKQTKPVVRPKKPTPKPEVKKEETKKVEETKVETTTSVDDAVDADADKKVAKVEADTKTVETSTPEKEESSNKTIFGILGALLVAAGAVFVFKKK